MNKILKIKLNKIKVNININLCTRIWATPIMWDHSCLKWSNRSVYKFTNIVFLTTFLGWKKFRPAQTITTRLEKIHLYKFVMKVISFVIDTLMSTFHISSKKYLENQKNIYLRLGKYIGYNIFLPFQSFVLRPIVMRTTHEILEGIADV